MTLPRPAGSAGNDGNWVAVGVVARAHALRGAVVVKPFTRTLDEFLAAPLEAVRPRRQGRVGTPLRIIGASPMNGGVALIEFEGIGDRTAAEALIGAELVIAEDERWELDEDEFYIDDLVGMAVVEQGTGRELGPVLRVEEGAQAYLVLPNPQRPGAEARLPFVGGLVPEVDSKARRIVAIIPEGLFDL
jgi:16S rRNA processing protein RimM